MTSKHGYDKRLGTSKREQGIVTPKQPRSLKHRAKQFGYHHTVQQESLIAMMLRFLNTDITKLSSFSSDRLRKRKARKPVVMNVPQPMTPRPRIFRHQSR